MLPRPHACREQTFGNLAGSQHMRVFKPKSAVYRQNIEPPSLPVRIYKGVLPPSGLFSRQAQSEEHFER